VTGWQSRFVASWLKSFVMKLKTHVWVLYPLHLSHAVIYCSLFNHDNQQEAIDVLNRAVGFIRKEIARRIRARIVPTLKFVIDESVVRGAVMDDLISEAINSDKKNSNDEESE